MGHTFLFEEGIWRVEGEHRDGSGTSSAVAGENTIRHEPGRWQFEAVLRLRGDPLRVTHNRYHIEPFSPGAASTHWSSKTSFSARYAGASVECIQQCDERRYSVRGAMLEEDKLISTWALELVKL